MTSYTRKLYNRDPAAAEDFARQTSFETRLTYGKHATLACFGLRKPEVSHVSGEPIGTACASFCGHPACQYGCTNVGQAAKRAAFMDGH